MLNLALSIYLSIYLLAYIFLSDGAAF